MIPRCWIDGVMLRPNHRWHTLCMPNNVRYSLSLMAKKIEKINIHGMPGKKYRCSWFHKVQYLRTLLDLSFFVEGQVLSYLLFIICVWCLSTKNILFMHFLETSWGQKNEKIKKIFTYKRRRNRKGQYLQKKGRSTPQKTFPHIFQCIVYSYHWESVK